MADVKHLVDRMTDRSRRVLEIAEAERIAAGDRFIGTDHILLAIASEGNGVGGLILHEAGLDYQKAKQEVDRINGL